MEEHIIEVENLSKSYGAIKAVNDISFYVEKNKLFAFLGPNGAGKSTTIDIICTFLKPDNGKITVDGLVLGKDDNEIRRSIGAVFQDGLLDPILTVYENLKIRAGLYGLKGKELNSAILNTVEITSLTDILKQPYGKLSGGQRRRCDIARSLLHTPKILFLDEPTTGLDPQTRQHIWDTIKSLQKNNDMTIFMTTHYMEEAADADYVIVIDKGSISAKGSPMALKDKYANDRLKLSCNDIKAVISLLQQAKIDFEVVAGTVIVKLATTLDAIEILESCKEYLKDFEVLNGTMDDAFIGITGREIRE